jgi:hypothetical protein
MARAILAALPSISFRLNNPNQSSHWPASERFPKNLDQALEFGWTMDDETWESSPDERTRTGTVHLHKTVNGTRFRFAVRARATLEFGRLQLL